MIRRAEALPSTRSLTRGYRPRGSRALHSGPGTRSPPTLMTDTTTTGRSTHVPVADLSVEVDLLTLPESGTMAGAEWETTTSPRTRAPSKTVRTVSGAANEGVGSGHRRESGAAQFGVHAAVERTELDPTGHIRRWCCTKKWHIADAGRATYPTRIGSVGGHKVSPARDEGATARRPPRTNTIPAVHNEVRPRLSDDARWDR